MRRFLLSILVLLTFSGVAALAQDYRVDTLKVSQVDSTLVGRSILSVLGPGVVVNQSPAMKAAFERYLSSSASKKMSGYRIRVYFESGQDARSRSESIARSIANAYPGLGVYRTFVSPNFKVSVGDFRTKDEALKVYQALKGSYPTALILKETINYPR